MVVLGCLACTETHRDVPALPALASPPRQRVVVGGYRALVPQNAEVASASGIDQIQPGGVAGYGLTGRGVVLGEWDQGTVRDTHEILVGRVTLRDGAGLSDHATHTAGTIIGSSAGNLEAAGMAPGAELWSYSWDLDLVRMLDDGLWLSASNHSYGITLGWLYDPACPDLPAWAGGGQNAEDPEFGKYDTWASELDRVLGAADLVSVWAAGNERADGPTTPAAPHHHWPSCDGVFTDSHVSEAESGYDTIGGQPTAKNAITVGAVVDLPAGYQSADILPLSSSSFGPLDDGRIKPDLVAGGDDVTSAVAWNDAAYASDSGTSSAAAAVTGGIALLVEQYRKVTENADPRAAEIKALLIHTAREAGPSLGPDYQMGYGLFDARAAADLLAESAKLIRVDWTDGSTRDVSTTEPVPAQSALRVTLAWTEPAGAPNSGGIDDPAPALVNDLDLELIAPDGATRFYPWSLDPSRPAAPGTRTGPNRVDNVEVVDVTAAENRWNGIWTVRVLVNGSLLRNHPQDYALVSTVTLSPSPRPTLASPARVYLEASPSAPLNSEALVVQNLGSEPLGWHATESVPWLALGRDAGGGGEALELDVDATGLPSPGLYFGRIALSSNDPTARPELGVVLRVSCQPACDGRVCGPDPVCGLSCGRCSTRYACSSEGQCQPLGSACPEADLGSELGVALVASANDLTGNSSAGSCGGDDTADTAFSWTAPHAAAYRFSTDGSRYDDIVYLRADDCDGAELACGDESATAELAAGQRVVAVVDGPGEFMLNIEEVTCPAADLGSLLGTRVFSQLSPARGRRDVALRWRAPSAASYTFAASGIGFDPEVCLLAGNCAGPVLACGAGSATVTLGAGEEVIVVLAGARGLSDRYSLGITATGLECADGAGLCWCDDRCADLGDCCVDAPCPACQAGQICEFGRCMWPRCSGGACEACHRCVDDRCEPVPDGQTCDDGDACTTADTCAAGVCRPGPLVCEADASTPSGPDAGSNLRPGGGACTCSLPRPPGSKGSLGLLLALGPAVAGTARKSAKKG